MAERYLALDMGAESGRGVVGTLRDDDGLRLTLEEVHRFPNTPIRLPDAMHWNLPYLHREQRTAIARAAEGGPIAGIGVDTWGVDYGLLDESGALMGLPVHYRDPRTNGWIDRVFDRVPKAEVFARTGIQIMQINTLFQLAAHHAAAPKTLEAARRLLFMPDLFHYLLTGRDLSEFTIATTSQMYDPRANRWATELLDSLGVPTHFLPEVAAPGTEYGSLLPYIAQESGAGEVPVIAPAGHDTACAVAAVPAEGRDGWAFLSSGTWSLLGVEVSEPIINAQTEAANFTNEGGVDGTIRLLKNIGGLWLVQECRRAWARLGEERSYEKLTRLAADAAPLTAFVDPDHADLLAPDDMPAAIRSLCRATGQPEPEGIGATVRCALDSLALKYRWTLERMEEITGRSIHTLHIVGGGTQNTLLNQLAADATGRVVKTGPIEATAIGNVLLQARSRGRIASLEELRAVVRRSFTIDTYEPTTADRGRWDDAYGRFLEMVGK